MYYQRHCTNLVLAFIFNHQQKIHRLETYELSNLKSLRVDRICLM